MRWFTRLRLVPQLVIPFLAVAFIAATIGAIRIHNVGLLASQDRRMFTSATAPMQSLDAPAAAWPREGRSFAIDA